MISRPMTSLLDLLGPVEVGAVDEAEMLFRVDVANRQGERVQLALGQRQQGLSLHPFAVCLLRRVVEAGQ